MALEGKHERLRVWAPRMYVGSYIGSGSCPTTAQEYFIVNFSWRIVMKALNSSREAVRQQNKQ